MLSGRQYYVDELILIYNKCHQIICLNECMVDASKHPVSYKLQNKFR